MSDNIFGDYRAVLSEALLNEIEPLKKNKFIAVMKLKYPVEGANMASRKKDVLEVLDIHNKANEDKYMELLDIKNIYLILGLELPAIYGIEKNSKRKVSNYIGNSLSKKLYHNYNWSDFTTVPNSLFTAVEIKKLS